MLELRSYTKPEMSALLGTRNMEGLKRKLRGYGIEFECQGRGEYAVFTIKDLGNPFKIYCITELDFDGRTDFHKLRNFYYYFFNDIEFRAMPDEVKENRMRSVHKDISRQTIATYTRKLYLKNFIDTNTSNFIYYFAYEDTQRIVEKEEYCTAWREYWEDIENGFSSFEAICNMRYKYNGVARKQSIPEINGFHNKDIEYLCTLIQKDIEAEIQRN